MNVNRAFCAVILACVALVGCGRKVASPGEQCAPGFIQNPPNYPPCDVGLVCAFCIPDTGVSVARPVFDLVKADHSPASMRATECSFTDA
jgi:hypothetical protein